MSTQNASPTNTIFECIAYVWQVWLLLTQNNMRFKLSGLYLGLGKDKQRSCSLNQLNAM